MISRRNFFKSSALTLAVSKLKSIDISSASEVTADPTSAKFWQNIRDMYPLAKDEVYFNTGTLGAMPTDVYKKITNELDLTAIHLARHHQKDGPTAMTGYNPAIDFRQKVASFIGADLDEVSLTQNATMGMNFIANGLELRPGDEVITTDQEHPGGRCAWDLLARRKNVVFKFVPLDVPASDPEILIDRFKKSITPKTRVITFAHITSNTGTVLPAKELCELARRNGVISVIDGAQSLGHVPVNVKDIGCDVYFSSPHKWLCAPAGNGILYINKTIISDVWATLASDAWDNHNDNGYRFTHRGTGSYPIQLGLDAAIDFYNKIGPEHIIKRIKFLGDYMRSGLKKIKNVVITTAPHPDMCAGMTAYSIPGVEPSFHMDELWRIKKIHVRIVDYNAIRASTHIYNSTEEIDAALEVAAELAKKS